MSEKKYYCFCSSNCRYETMTKEQILAAIAQAVETGRIGDCDTGFVTKVKEGNGGGYVTFWVGTRAQYNALSSIENNCVYIITDDTSAADLVATVEQAAADAAAAAESAVNSPSSLMAAYANGYCADALDVDYTNTFAEKNRPMAVQFNKTANIPDNFANGVRLVFYANMYNVVVMLVGVTKTLQPVVLVNYGSVNEWGGWVQM